VTYGCEAWTLTSRDEQHLTIFGSRILRLKIENFRVELEEDQGRHGSQVLKKVGK